MELEVLMNEMLDRVDQLKLASMVFSFAHGGLTSFDNLTMKYSQLRVHFVRVWQCCIQGRW